MRQAGPGSGDEYRDVDLVGRRPIGGSGDGTAGDRGRSALRRLLGARPGRGALEAVLTEVAKGDNAAFGALYDRAAPAVLGTVRRDPA